MQARQLANRSSRWHSTHRRTFAMTTPRAVQLDTVTDVQQSHFSKQLDEKLSMLQMHKADWGAMPLARKVAVLKEVKSKLLDNMYSWGKAGASVRGQANDKWAIAENTLINPVVLKKYLDTLIGTLEYIQVNGKCPEVPIRTTPQGQQVAKVFPATEADKADRMAGGTTAELYIQPGKPASQGGLYVGPGCKPAAKVAALLGAGNLGFLGVKDVLYELFECGNVVLFKPHPIQAEYHKWADQLLEPLSRLGVYASIYTDSVAETQQMLYHPDVEHVHMTGGTGTHDAIVWGPKPEEQAARKAAKDPVLKVPITSELGCVTPWLVTPGQWSPDQLRTHALQVAHGVHFNNSCACNSLKVLLLPSCWGQADELLSEVKRVLGTLELQPAWYPGHNQRYNAWKAMFPNAEAISAPAQPSSRDLGPNAQPMPYLINEVPYAAPGEQLSEQQQYAFQVEPFAPVLTVVRVPCSNATEYMSKATAFANQVLWGTLSCTVLLHPDVEAQHPAEAQQMLDELQYGVIGVNGYSGMCYSTPHAMWGAYVGDQTLENVGSGIGYINNTLMFDYPQKAVVRFPFMGSQTPRPMQTMGLPAAAYGPLTGLLVGGGRGLFRALVSGK